DLVHRGANGLAAVADDGDVEPGRQGGAQARQLGLDALDGLDRVGAGLALDNQYDGAVAVVGALPANIFGVVDDLGNVGQADRRPVAVGHDQLLVALGAEQLVVGGDRERLPVAVDAALG